MVFITIQRFTPTRKPTILTGSHQKIWLEDIRCLLYLSVSEIDVFPFVPINFVPEILGEGPRVCIGLRFGMIETKVGLATLLSKFKFHKSERTQIPLAFSKKNIVLSPEGGLFLRIEKI